MKVLIIGGTGLISTGIIKHLIRRGADITMYNRGQRERGFEGNIPHIQGDRSKASEFEDSFKDARYDVIIDMICFRPEEAESDIRAFAGRCEHFLCRPTGCTYGMK